MSLVTAVIMPVKLFIYIATQISSLLRTVINILKEEYDTISVAILQGTAVFKKVGRYRKIILRYDYKSGILLSTNDYCQYFRPYGTEVELRNCH